MNSNCHIYLKSAMKSDLTTSERLTKLVSSAGIGAWRRFPSHQSPTDFPDFWRLIAEWVSAFLSSRQQLIWGNILIFQKTISLRCFYFFILWYLTFIHTLPQCRVQAYFAYNGTLCHSIRSQSHYISSLRTSFVSLSMCFSLGSIPPLRLTYPSSHYLK